MHHPIDPLFLVIPLILSLLPADGADDKKSPFQPLSSLLSTAASSSAHGLSQPFTGSAGSDAPKSEYNEDVTRLLRLKPVRRVFRLCCEKKGTCRRLADLCRCADLSRPSWTAVPREPRWSRSSRPLHQSEDAILVYGVLPPIAGSRVEIATDQSRVVFGGRTMGRV